MNTLCKKLLTYILLSSTSALLTMEPGLPEITPLSTDELDAQWEAEALRLSVSEFKELFPDVQPAVQSQNTPPASQQTNSIYSGKDLQCTFCKQSFNKNYHFTIHAAFCTSYKQLKCPYEGCNKKYMRSSHLAKHMQSHEQASQLSNNMLEGTCNLAQLSQSYMQPLSLEKSEIERGKYFCKYCNKNCNTSDDFSRHKKSKKHIDRVRTLTPYNNFLK